MESHLRTFEHAVPASGNVLFFLLIYFFNQHLLMPIHSLVTS